MSVTEKSVAHGDVITHDPAYASAVNKRKGHRAYVTKTLKKVEDLLKDYSEVSASRVMTYRKSLVEKIEVLSGFDELIIGMTEEADIEEEMLKCDDIKDNIQEMIFRIDMQLVKESKPTPMPSFFPTTNESKSAKLPKLSLPVFTGNPIEYQSFWDSFEASVHGDSKLDDVVKFSYLKSVLRGQALSAISGLSLTSENYVEAVDILKKRYGNKQLLISSHMEKLLSIPSVSSINDVGKVRKIYDEIEVHARNLRSLDVNTKNYGPALISIIMAKLPTEIKLVISRAMSAKKEWDVDDVLRILQEEIESREMCQLMTSALPPSKKDVPLSSEADQYTAASLVAEAKSVRQCVFCNREHPPSRCSVVTDIQSRKSILRKKGRCFLCLQSSHISRNCKSTYRCVKCNSRHNVSICEPPPRQQDPPPADPPKNEPSHKPGINPLAKSFSGTTQATRHADTIFLQTAAAKITDDKSMTSRTVRVLFDGCSQKSFVTSHAVEGLNLDVTRTEKLIVNGFGCDDDVTRSLNVRHLRIWDVDLKNFVEVEVYEVPFICSPICNQKIDLAKATYEHLIDLPLADSADGNEELSIDILIGADHYYRFVSGEMVKDGPKKPVALKTTLGWVLSGSMEGSRDPSSTNVVTIHTLLAIEQPNKDEKLLGVIDKFWKIESVDVENDETETRNDVIMREFKESIKFDGSNYHVLPPIKSAFDQIHDNYDVCRARLFALLNRLRKNPPLLKDYDQIMRDQLKEGVIEDVDENESGDPGRVYYMPHREVVKRERDTTKVRIVYDASSKSRGPSLNECLETGPSLLPKIFDILVRFRGYRIGLTSDIKSAFLNVRIQKSFRNFVRFLWIDDVTKRNPKIVEKRFTSVPFGVTNSPFCLSATIVVHLEKFIKDYPDVVKKFLEDLYMDDSATGCETIQDAFEFYLRSKGMMKEGGFELLKWTTNNEELQKKIDENEILMGNEKVVTKKQTKVLGINWDTESDELLFSFENVLKLIGDDDPTTKRFILHFVCSVFDPLGVLSPVVITFKMLFQELCMKKCSWDEELDEAFKTRWMKMLLKLKSFECIRIPRFYAKETESDDVTRFELHGFADASQKAYACVIYLRCVTANHVFTQFLASKTRVAPLNAKTIPRLELLSCLLLSRLMKTVLESLTNVAVGESFCWTDSIDCKFWINRTEKLRPKFIQNRVVEIRRNVPGVTWKHCPGKLNPADIPSRGLDISKPGTRTIWIDGPEFLRCKEIPNFPAESAEIETVHSDNVSMVTRHESMPCISNIVDVERYGSLNRLLMVTSYVLRFIKNCKVKLPLRDHDEINQAEINLARNVWIKEVQTMILNDAKYMKGLMVSLGAYIDTDGFIRLKGRLEKSDVDCKTPILLPTKHYFTNLVIRDCHVKVLHSGMKDTLVELRGNYWVTKGRATVKRVVEACRLCRLYGFKLFKKEPAAPLPEFRGQLSYPFSSTGIDYMGPLFVYPSPGKNKSLRHKVHVVLFTCATTRAVVLDLVPDGSSPAFCRCLKRFVSRKGKPKLFVSDNAKCFIGPSVKRLLRELNCEWEFILEKSPWWGGFWERLVQTVKRSMRKNLEKSILSYEELLTVISEIESVMNSRPLCYQYSDEIDDVITPSHLMHGRRMRTDLQVEEITVEETDITLQG